MLKRLGRVSVRNRLLGGFGFVGLLTVGFALMAISGLQELARLSSDLYEHPMRVTAAVLNARNDISEVKVTMRDLVSAERGQVEDLVGREIQLESDIDGHLAEIRRLYLGNPADIDDVDRALAAWRPVRDEIIALMRQNRQAEALARRKDTSAQLIAAVEKELADISVFAANKASQFNAAAATRRNEVAHLLYITLGGILLAGVAASAVIHKSILGQLRRLKSSMTAIVAGDHGLEVPERDGGGIVGEIAAAVEVFRQSASRLSEENWLKGHMADLSTAMQYVADRRSLAEMVIGRLVRLTGSAAGVLYGWRKDGEQLELLGQSGFAGGDGHPETFRLGEGLVGRCGLEKAATELADIPEGYFRVLSGLGEAPPRRILVAPLLSKGELLGVVELASFDGFDGSRRALIDQLLPVVALNLDLLERSRQARLLFEETRAQADELQTSEEELKAQSEELQESLEELRAQREELMATNEELLEKGEALRERQEALEKARAESENRAVELGLASRYKSEFLANMSHELRTPLNSLLILAKSLADNEEQTLTEEQIESAGIIHDSGNHLLRLINDILDLSKIEAGKMEAVIEEVAIDALAHGIRRRFLGLATARRLSLTVEVAPGLPATIRVDAGMLDQIVNNLVGNAIKFTREGRIEVSLAGGDWPEGVGPAEGGPAFRLAVSDTGVGVDPEKRQRIFRAFEQADGTTSREFGGTGLGLSIAQKLAGLMGGAITLDSIEGKGSTFTLYLPLPAAPEAAAQAGAEAPTAAAVDDDRELLERGDDIILVIEDDGSFARLLCDMARRQGFKCLRAADGPDGLALALRYRPTGILLDIALPGMDGWAVIAELKRRPELRHIPVHFISAIDDSVRGLQMGAAGYLQKPVTREQMDEVFERLRHFSGGSPRRVLIVDDDSGSRKATRKLVQGKQVAIVEAASGGHALELLKQQSFDCLVLDLLLPDFSGFELLDRASAEQIVLPPVVVYSGKDLSYEENLKLREYTDSIVIKGARSPERLVDEVSLFLHSVQAEAPAAAQAARAMAASASVASAKDEILAGRVVLLVDDDMRNAFALSKVLRARGLKVNVAQDGDKALAQLAANDKIELVLMDIMMPGMDGDAAIREIRRQARFASLPVLALTAKAMQGDRERCLEAGADDYLSKPVDTEALLARMRDLLAGAAR
ncbi:MAG TPA: response regulator [Rhodospirillaceae bacterium]|nr:response regulator [Rhodospirillaceae bacterium]